MYSKTGRQQNRKGRGLTVREALMFAEFRKPTARSGFCLHV